MNDQSCRKKDWRYRRSKSLESYHQRRRLDITLDFPFLQDEETSQYFKKSKIMIIMRGLPGSGKSYLANKIKEKYGKWCFVCSADQFFERNGVYNFDPSKLKAAHHSCKQKSIQAFKNGKRIIVIDNCNVCIWEFRDYLSLADENGYVQLIIEPKTPWKFTPGKLVSKNKHGLKYDMLERRLNQWEYMYPLYFGWFINEEDAFFLKQTAISCFIQCLNISQFSMKFGDLMQNPRKDFLHYYGLNKFPVFLHCTSKYCGKNNAIEAKRYLDEVAVQNEYGKVSKLNVIGFIISPQSFGAWIDLNDSQLQLWNPGILKKYNTPSKNRSGLYQSNSIENCFVNDLISAFSSLDIKGVNDETVQCTAHITLGNKKGIQPKQTGIDLSLALEISANSQFNQKYIPAYKIKDGWIKQYDENWIVTLEKIYQVNGLFASCLC